LQFSEVNGRNAFRKRIAKMNDTALISRTFSTAGRMFALLFLLTLPGHALASQFENLDGLDSLVAMTVGANQGQPGGPLAPIDRRLRLKPCPSTPKVEGPVFGAAVVSCAEVGWRIRVPLSGVAPAANSDRVPLFATAQTHGSMAQQSARAEKVVKKGDPVELIAAGDAFSISRLMIADEDGAVGDMIRVREDSKSNPVSARVERAGRVRAPTI
jgi:flagella basal body P-ring formation protein FlgA